MRRLRTIPLANGLLGGSQGSTYGQLEVTLTDYKIVKILIKRKPYTGQSNVKFSIPFSSLRELIDLLNFAQERLDGHWLSMITNRPPEDEIIT